MVANPKLQMFESQLQKQKFGSGKVLSFETHTGENSFGSITEFNNVEKY